MPATKLTKQLDVDVIILEWKIRKQSKSTLQLVLYLNWFLAIHFTILKCQSGLLGRVTMQSLGNNYWLKMREKK